MRPLDADDIAFYQTFGYVTLRAWLDDKVGVLFDEVRGALASAYARVGAEADAIPSGVGGEYVPMVDDRSPVSRSLVVEPYFLELAESLLGTPPIPKPPKGMCYHDASPWHADSYDPNLHAIKIAAYFTPLDSLSGALRVLPGSHCGAFYETLRAYRERAPWGDPSSEDREGEEMEGWPGVAVETDPGDIIVFDVHLWHASVLGRNRFQWTVSYAAEPANENEAESVRTYISSFLQAGHPYDITRFPYYDPQWFDGAQPPPFLDQLERLGLRP